MDPDVILDFWFRELEPRHWFLGSKKLDAKIRRRFAAWVTAAMNGDLDAWSSTPRGRLALILLLDQFTRNIHRGTSLAFAGDAKARGLVLEGLAVGDDRSLHLSERQFFYMPLVHAEDAKLQALGGKSFATFLREAQSIVKHQKDHAAVIQRFGRFPTRNAALGRISTAAEKAFLDELKRNAAARPRRAATRKAKP